MPTNKDFKRLVRGRMQKTGESYTAARTTLLKKPRQKQPANPAPADYARLAGMSDAALKAKTGCTWQRWVGALDGVKASTWPHREIAQYVQKKYKVPDWWAQTVTVGYERIRGLREIGQRRGGSYEATKSRTFPVPVSSLFQAFGDPERRAAWIPGVKLTVRKATPDKTVRITWEDGTSVVVGLAAKGPGKAQAQVQHAKLPSREAATRIKQYWDERLDVLHELLTRSTS